MGLLDRIRQRKADAERHRIKRAMRWGDKAETSDSCVDGACVWLEIFFWRKGWRIRCFRLLVRLLSYVLAKRKYVALVRFKSVLLRSTLILNQRSV